ncbi:MAG: hypothetical protein JWO00_275 [Candidatus Parcubacteria bacterium]|nr:hypothetical protein [Candidatus Parcubacteria bacterium]
MRITFLASGSIRSNFSYRILALARSLRAHGNSASIIAPSADKYNNFSPEKINEIDGVKILQPFQLKTKRLEINLIPYLFGAFKALLKEKPEVIYIYKPTPISAIGLFGKMVLGAETVVDFDDLGSEVMRIEGHPSYQRKLVEWSERICAHYADRLVVTSSLLFDLYTKKYPKKPIIIIPNGVEKDWLNKPLVVTDAARIVFMGSLNRKTILGPLFEVLPKVIAKYPSLKVLVIGDGTYLSYFKDLAAKDGLTNNVSFTGWLALDAARSQLHSGDIGYNYMPDEITVKAASNMKMPQYMSRGVVPFVSDVGDLSRTIGNGSAGYICPAGDAGSLFNVLVSAIQDPNRSDKVKNAIHLASTVLSWDTLAQNFQAWVRPSGNTHPKIYVVATAIPGNFGGGEMRNFNLIKQLIKQLKPNLHIFCISQNNIPDEIKKFESQTTAKIHIAPSAKRTWGSTLRAIVLKRVPPYMDDFQSSNLGSMFRMACEESLPDIVHIEQIHAYYCVRPHIPWLKKMGVRIIFDCHNVEFRGFKDSLEIFSLSKRLIGTYLTPHMKKIEIEATKYSDAILACSEIDAAFFRAYNKNVHIIPNGVDCSEFVSDKKPDKPILIFMGSAAYPPNADAAQFYLTSIHPIVKRSVPNVQLLAIGIQKSWLEENKLADPSVDGLGFVDDVRVYLSKAAIGISPIRYGSGTRIKIMTYMATGLPVISTSKGAEGVDYENGKNIILADEAETFAAGVIKLLNDRVLRDKIANNGYSFIRDHYDWDVIGKNLKSIYLHGIS